MADAAGIGDPVYGISVATGTSRERTGSLLPCYGLRDFFLVLDRPNYFWLSAIKIFSKVKLIKMCCEI